MAMMDVSLLVTLFSDNVVKHVFKEILKNRTARFKELLESVDTEQDAKHKDQIESAVKMLMEADLIKEREAPIKDFSTYYVTEYGLTAERQLRLAGHSRP
jgi:hypothetical protein